MQTNKSKRFNYLRDELKKNPMMSPISTQMDILNERYGEEYVTISENLLELLDKLGYDVLSQTKHYMFDYIKGMTKFIKNGEYNNGTYEDIQCTVYDNGKKMKDVYLPGLYIAHATTILVYTKCHLFFTKFMPLIGSNAKGVDVGFGEGFYIWYLLTNIPGSKCIGFDISEHSVNFTEQVLKTIGINDDRYVLSWGDIRTKLPVEDASMDYGIIAEVIEHIDEPGYAVKEMGRIIKPNGVLFVSTVKDSNHMDHITNFESTEYVENLLNMAGFDVVEKSIQRNQDDFPESHDISTGLAYVCVKRSSIKT